MQRVIRIWPGIEYRKVHEFIGRMMKVHDERLKLFFKNVEESERFLKKLKMLSRKKPELKPIKLRAIEEMERFIKDSGIEHKEHEISLETEEEIPKYLNLLSKGELSALSIIAKEGWILRDDLMKELSKKFTSRSWRLQIYDYLIDKHYALLITLSPDVFKYYFNPKYESKDRVDVLFVGALSPIRSLYGWGIYSTYHRLSEQEPIVKLYDPAILFYGFFHVHFKKAYSCLIKNVEKLKQKELSLSEIELLFESLKTFVKFGNENYLFLFDEEVKKLDNALLELIKNIK